MFFFYHRNHELKYILCNGGFVTLYAYGIGVDSKQDGPVAIFNHSKQLFPCGTSGYEQLQTSNPKYKNEKQHSTNSSTASENKKLVIMMAARASVFLVFCFIVSLAEVKSMSIESRQLKK